MAADEAELMHMVRTMAEIDDRPSAVRYPRAGIGIDLPERGTPLPIGKGRMVRGGRPDRAAVVRRASPGVLERRRTS